MQLTAEQRAIVEHGLEHCLITAVAGSGKTTTLAWRIRHLLEQGQDPARLLILMFNRSAREDFEHKLAKVCANTGLQRPDVRTYHALGLRLYKRFVQEGYLPDWQGQPLSEAEIQLQVWHLLRQLVPDAQQDRLKREKKEAIALACQFIDRAKTTLRPADSVFEDMGLAPEMHYLIDVFHGFEHWRKRTHRISFADMLYEPVMAIHQHGALQKLVGNKMDMILVDEYQDT
ncbi:MAG: UvrD-helicase domain-containing protein, partial [Gammaproteobacteria bacterium]|nr:UvrD-helicase domain-containing protein [Gammaproteobacteria bacterium]